MPTTGRHAAASRHRQLAAWQLAACMLGGAMLAGLAAMPADATILFSTITTSTSTQFEVSAPSIDRGLVTYLANPGFLGNPGYQQVVVTDSASHVSLTVAQAGSTAIPGGAPGEQFDYFTGVPTIDAGRVAFLGGTLGVASGSAARQGIYVATPQFGGSGYTLQKVVDTSTVVPGGTGTFQTINAPFMANGDLVFNATDSAGKPGIYRLPADGGPLQVVANTNTPVPFVNASTPTGSAGTFSYFSQYPTVSNGVVAFTGESSGTLPGGRHQEGLFLADAAGTITARADRATGLGQPGNDTLFQVSPTISAGATVFVAGIGTFPGGPYSDLAYYLPASGNGGPFATAGQQFQFWPALDLGLLAYTTDANGIASNLGLGLGVPIALPTTILNVGDAIDDSGTTFYGFPSFLHDGQMGPLFHQAADYESGQIAFRALLGPAGWDMTGPPPFPLYEAIVVAFVPEPGTFALFGTGLGALAAVARSRRRREI